MTILLSQVATEQDLEAELGGQAALDNLVDESLTAKRAMTLSLADVLYELANRTPPVREADIAVPAELKRPVIECTIARLYCNGITTPDGTNAAKYSIYNKRYQATIANLRPTVGAGELVAAPFGIAMHRR